MSNILTMTIFPLMMVLAGIGDVMTMRIPNWLNAAIVVLFFVFAFALGMPFDVMKWHLLAAGVMLVLGMAVFYAGWFGGGDAKMLAAGAIWIGWNELIPFAVYAAFAGGALAVAAIVWQLIRIDQEARGASWTARIFRKDLQLPYGAAIAAGAVLAFPQTWWLKAVI